MVMKSSSASMEAVLVEAPPNPKGVHAVAESEAARLERSTKHRSSGDDVLHELGNRLNLLTFERGFAGVLRFFSACGNFA